MSARYLSNQNGLALLGSLLLVSMLAVLSTAFLLVMAADVRIAQSHYRITQANYHAESAAEVSARKLSSDSSIQALVLNLPQDFSFGSPGVLPSGTTVSIQTWNSGTDSFKVVAAYPIGYPSNRRLLWVQGFSSKASIDIYQDILLPTQDPRTYYTIVAGSKLELRDGCRVEGGDGVWMSGIGRDPYIPPFINDHFVFLSPSAGNHLLMVGSTILWDGSGIDPAWGMDPYMNIHSNAPIFSDIVPQILLDDTPPYYYKVTGDNTEYKSGSLPKNIPSGGSFGATGSFGVIGDNPMGIWVWDYADNGKFEDVFTLDGTLYCPNSLSILEFRDGNVTITPIVYTLPDPDERYPAIVSKGQINIRGDGTRRFNGLVYCGYFFDSDPAPNDTCYVDGMLIADRIRLRHRTVVRYDSTMQTQPAAPFAAGVYPTIILHQRRYMYSIF